MEFKRVPLDRCVPLIATRFRGRAAAWWSQLKKSRAREGKNKIVSWDKLQKQLKKNFLPFNYEQILFQKLQSLRQGSRYVEDYATEFFLLLNRIDLQDSEKQLIARFFGGLRQNIHHTLNLFNPLSLAEAHQQALTIEAQTKGKFSGWSSSRPSRQITPTPAATVATTPNTETATVPVDTTRPARQSNLRCFSWGELGHRQSGCPTRNRRGLLLDEAGHDVEVIDDETETENPECLVADSGPLLMLRRSCLAPLHSVDFPQRNNLFHSKCTIQGKVCSLIVDSGSSENVIAEHAVQKLGLKEEPHPTPYKLSWLQQGNDILISRRALVAFSIGNAYNDEILCDIALMDPCHLLLGRPWEFDRKVLHDGFLNTYSFKHQNRSFTLQPSLPPKSHHSPSPTLLLQ